MKFKYYSLKNILALNAQYNIIYGERSNGKTYAVKKYALEEYWNHGKKLAYLRRWREDFRGKRASTLWNDIVNNKEVKRITGGQYDTIVYWASAWYLAFTQEDEKTGEMKIIRAPDPFAYAFALTDMEHDKGETDNKIATVLFDEFLTRRNYLPEEFIIFVNVLSTIIRLRDDVKIFMLGNTVNQYSPYFAEMGLNNIEKIKPGEIAVYEYGESGLRVAVEFSDFPSKNKPSNVYFAFNNPKLHMITGTDGSIWEMNLYPHCPCKFEKSEIIFTYFILFDGKILQCDIVTHNDLTFTFIHQKTTPLRNPDTDLIYSLEYDPRPNWRRLINRPILDIEKKIWYFFASDKIFYQDNETGEIVRNYLQNCGKVGVLK